MPVVIVSDSQIFRSALGKCCEQRDIVVGQSCAQINEIRSLQDRDLVLLHTGKAAEEIRNDIRYLDTLAEGLRIILLTAKGASKGATVDLRTALGESVSAIIPDDRSIDALIGALAVVQEGYSLVPQRTIADAQATLVSQKLRQREPFMGDHLGKLSARENMILSRLTSGDSNKDIANDLGICETTVKVHLRTCYQKIGASNRTQAAVWAVLHL